MAADENSDPAVPLRSSADVARRRGRNLPRVAGTPGFPSPPVCHPASLTLMNRLFSLPHALTTDDWYTPAWIFEGMGETFDLDVCTPPGGVPWIPADSYYTPDDDGLAHSWHGFVWCNPPYSSPFAWCDKWASHGNGVIVLRADISSRGPAAAYAAATSMFVPTPRLQFVNGHGEQRESVNFSTVLFGAGDQADVALARLSRQGRGITRALVERV